MATIRRFEELIAWQKSRAMTKQVYSVTRKKDFARDFGLANQVQRASVSTMSNIAEGFERARRKEFHQALSTSKASCAEVRSLLYVALDVGYLDQNEFDSLMSCAEETSRVVGGLRAAIGKQVEQAKAQRKAVSRPSSRTQSSALSPQS